MSSRSVYSRITLTTAPPSAKPPYPRPFTRSSSSSPYSFCRSPSPPYPIPPTNLFDLLQLPKTQRPRSLLQIHNEKSLSLDDLRARVRRNFPSHRRRLCIPPSLTFRLILSPRNNVLIRDISRAQYSNAAQ